jgi:putative ABC transport system ATP-binding protein
MGPSGAGKSTLLQCSAGLDRPSSGSVLIDGADITRMNEDKLTKLRRDQLGFIFQAFNLLPSMTAIENVGLPLRLAKRRPERGELLQALASVDLAEHANRLPSQLSGGQQQRVAIARALAVRPKIVFADEPTGALDRKAGKAVLALLRKLVDHIGQTVVMVTHDPVAASYADRVLFIADGRLVDEISEPTVDMVTRHMASLGE